MMQKHALLMLLIAAGAVASVAAKAPTFADWLAVQADGSQKKAGAAAAETAYEREYEEVETMETCLKAVATRNCDSFDTFHWESGLACCNGKYYNKEMNSFVSKATEIGDCHFTEFVLSVPVPVYENVHKTGTFIATCNLNGHADDCGAPFCDKMVLNVQGNIYKVDNAIVSSIPNGPTQEGTCDADNEDFQRNAANLSPLMKELREHHMKRFSGKKSTTAKAAYDRESPEYEQYRGYEHPQPMKIDSANVYYGAMTVTSRFHNAKVSGGWFEYVRIDELGTPTPVTSVVNKYVLDPWTYKLSFTKTKGY